MAADPTEIHASLLSLSEQALGDAFDTAASSGATTLSLYDVSDFDEDGGWVLVGGSAYAYDSVDMDADTLHLTSGLSAAAAVDDRADVWDPEGNVAVTERTALVTVDGQDDGDPLSVDVDHALAPLLVQQTLSAGQSVSVIRDGVGHRMVAVHGKNIQGLQRSDDATLWIGQDDGSGNVYGLIVALGGTVVRVGTLGDFRVKTPDAATYMPILASAFTVSSDSAVKTTPTRAPDALAIIEAAPAKCWRYLTDADDVKRIGPMANDLPDWMQQVIEEADGSSHLGSDMARLVGVLWQANAQLLARIEKLEKKKGD